MTDVQIVTAEWVDVVLLDQVQLAHACNVQIGWIIERVEAGLLIPLPRLPMARQRFDSAQLRRARHMATIESDFDANPELAALVVDLIEELRTLKHRLGQATER